METTQKLNAVYIFNDVSDLGNNFPAFKDEVLKLKQPFFLYKHMNGCGHCHEFRKHLYGKVKKGILAHMPIVEIEYDTYRHLISAHPELSFAKFLKGTPDYFPLLTVIVPRKGGYVEEFVFKQERTKKAILDHVTYVKQLLAPKIKTAKNKLASKSKSL